MKLQRSTLILMLIALGLAGGVYILEVRQNSQQEKIQALEKQIFSFSRDDVKSLTVTTPEQTLTVERLSETENPEESPWKLTQPVQTPANQATVDFLLNQLVTDQSIPQDPNIGLRSLTISKEQLPQYGLDKPQQTVEVTLKNEEVYKLSLGTKDFTGRSIYGIKNAAETEENLSILIIPEGIISAVVRPLEEWKAAEPEPEPAETETPPPPETRPEPENSETNSEQNSEQNSGENSEENSEENQPEEAESSPAQPSGETPENPPPSEPENTP